MLDSAAVPTRDKWIAKLTTAELGWLLLIVTSLYVGYFAHLGTLGFVGPDEPRYAWVAREMAESGDWVTPRLYGKPWFEKPVLYYWSAALSFKLFGVNERAARLPSAVAALFATLALAWLVWRFFGRDTAHWLLLVLPTTVGLIGFSHAASTDMIFSAMLVLTMVAAAVSVNLVPLRDGPSSRGRIQRLALAVFGFLLGAATLAKGPAALVLTAGSVALWALATRQWREAFRLLHPVAVLAFCAATLPWYALCAARNPEFLRVFLLEHNVARYLTPVFRHEQPIWFYAPVIIAGLFPWSPLFIADLYRMVRHPRNDVAARPDVTYLLTWAFFPVLFFSLSRSKLPGYILPSLPVLAVFAARAATSLLQKPRGVRADVWAALVAATPLIGAGVCAWGFERLFPAAAPAGILPFLMITTFIGLAACLVLTVRRNRRATLLFGVVATLVLILGAEALGLRWSDAIVSSRRAAQNMPSEAAWRSACAFRLRRGSKYALNFYLRRELPDCSLASPQPMMAFTSPSGLRELQEGHRSFRIVDSSCLNAILVEILPWESANGMSDRR
jgi:4-amino-4-deoxy-L-arabinose transferase-like glycosyltransferase